MTPGKLRMALTRLGRGSRTVVTSDPSQSNLPEAIPSGLSQILPLIVEAGLATVHHFDRHQIVRNEVVAKSGALREPG